MCYKKLKFEKNSFSIHVLIPRAKIYFKILFIKEFNYETLSFLDCRIPGSGELRSCSAVLMVYVL
jgi:hypothetical protein